MKITRISNTETRNPLPLPRQWGRRPIGYRLARIRMYWTSFVMEYAVVASSGVGGALLCTVVHTTSPSGIMAPN